jgi:hypothetical protein
VIRLSGSMLADTVSPIASVVLACTASGSLRIVTGSPSMVTLHSRGAGEPLGLASSPVAVHRIAAVAVPIVNRPLIPLRMASPVE